MSISKVEPMPRLNLEPVDLTPDQVAKWEKTRTMLVWQCPAFSHIFYSMLNKVGHKHIAMFTEDDNIPVAATDGRSLIFRASTFFALSDEERVFVVAHEIGHCMFGHCELGWRFQLRGKIGYSDGVTLDYNGEIMNYAEDFVINDMLIESKVGKYNPAWLHDPAIGKYTDAAIDVYRKLYEQAPKMGGGGAGGAGAGKQPQSSPPKGTPQGQSPFDKHLQPGTGDQNVDPTTAAAGRNEVEWKSAIAGAVAVGKASGKLPAAMARMFEDILEPTVDWKDKVMASFARKPGGGSYDWRKPDRRFITRGIVAPARSGFGSGPIVVVIDTSGSITQKILDMFFGEMAGIIDDVQPSKLYLMYCDAQVQGEVEELFDAMDLHDVHTKGARGGGGTSFVPPFEKVAELGIECDALIYLTDGMGTFPAQAPSYPVMWGSIREKSEYPFGEVIDLPNM